MAIQAGIAKMVIPSGMPCEKYKTIKVKYLKIGFSESDGIFLLDTALYVILVINVVDCRFRVADNKKKSIRKAP